MPTLGLREGECLDALQVLDHLVLATPDLSGTIADLETRLGVRAAEGGRHPNRGTRNAVIALSDVSYLEIIGVDPEQPSPTSARWFRVDSVTTPTLVAWAAKSSQLEISITAASEFGVELGEILDGHRTRPDGTPLSWRFTDPNRVVADGLVPFLIDWGESLHPAATAPRGPRLMEFRAAHPEPQSIQTQLRALGIALEVDGCQVPGLRARFSGPNGLVEFS